ncbi:DNA topoisomerase IV, alpha subunit [Cryphonectria parasitica EP155]|uniref:DNA topoisomerase (ATP-hydrolyzing) n=1 Tax=Cryphonectria parasitica (strain ATCC 38755 / EP155) TaxID=660469 RepID=A0A9P5CUK4_CRYP1|nr:DNA topoisomerase IV, alpha subunit [Cryphonectria parasitica EP155]KAF3771393.1 DNA topoisomerase IV, alpha subunit [Cryphonectria parasitica EP155]
MPEIQTESPPFSSQSSRILHVPHTESASTASLILSKIDGIFEDMVHCLAHSGDSMSIPYKSRTAPQQPCGALNFPGRTVNEAIKFSQMVRIMELSREALASGRLITKRNIYYQNPDLFKNQTIVDRLVDDLACTLGVSRNALNIAAASKGLITGPLSLTTVGGSVLSYSLGYDNDDLIPPINTIQQIDFAATRWILVVEKEATFRTLAASGYWRNCIHGQGIIVTGKGYADLATLKFLNLIHTLRPLIPVLCVVDCDPHGVDILRTYKYGSKGLSHEVDVRVPGLQWLGVKMDDIFRHDDTTAPTIVGGGASGYFVDNNYSKRRHWCTRPRRHPRAVESLISLTANDRKTAQRVLQSIEAQDAESDHEELEQVRELQVMLVLNLKAEIQAIDDMGDLSSWLNTKMEAA